MPSDMSISAKCQLLKQHDNKLSFHVELLLSREVSQLKKIKKGHMSGTCVKPWDILYAKAVVGGDMIPSRERTHEGS